MDIKYDYENTTVSAVGKKHGLSETELAETLNKYRDFPEKLEELRSGGGADYMNLPQDALLADSVSELAQEKRAQFENLVVLGIGGSSLGGRAVFEALSHPLHNLLPAEKRNAPRLFFPDNIDPEQIKALFDTLEPEKTLINIITKSGSTAETMANFMVFLGWFKNRLGGDFREHIIATTDPEKGALRKIARDEGFASLPVPPGVGGRFSVLSAVGLLPAAFAGVDIHKLLKGADRMNSRIRDSKPDANPAFLAALIHTRLDRQKSKHNAVFMPYAQCLRATADWFRQLWAESLGKKLSLAGEVINAGQTPIAALGTTDQHSQIQLYVEGPNDKLITLVEVEKFREEVSLPDLYPEEDSLAYLGGRTLNELMTAELAGTRIALTQAQRPNATITLPVLNEDTIGQLLFLLQVQTSYAGMIYGINPYDQPGVEAGKIAAYALMGREGYKDKLPHIS